jgi:elongator complex protein 3
MMPGQPGMSTAMCLEDFRRLFERSAWRPDYLKIYPTLVVRDTVVYDQWRREEFDPLTNEEAAALVARIKSILPKYVRLTRVQRDIPADYIDAGVWKSNLRQLARQRMADHGWTCDCIRCRDVGHNDADPDPDALELDTLTYEAAGGVEHFISIEDFDRDLLVGFCRLRFPSYSPHGTGQADRDGVRPELEDAALLRELHVYGSAVGLGDGDPDAQQHRGYGRRLMRAAEERAAQAGFQKLAVIAGIGARRYYRDKLGYYQDGPYVSKQL